MAGRWITGTLGVPSGCVAASEPAGIHPKAWPCAAEILSSGRPEAPTPTPARASSAEAAAAVGRSRIETPCSPPSAMCTSSFSICSPSSSGARGT